MASESQNFEFKASWRDKYLKWIFGFANASGGKLFVGDDDREEATATRDIMELEDKGILKKGIECGIQTGSWLSWLTMGSLLAHI